MKSKKNWKTTRRRRGCSGTKIGSITLRVQFSLLGTMLVHTSVRAYFWAQTRSQSAFKLNFDLGFEMNSDLNSDLRLKSNRSLSSSSRLHLYSIYNSSSNLNLYWRSLLWLCLRSKFYQNLSQFRILDLKFELRIGHWGKDAAESIKIRIGTFRKTLR